MLYVIVAICIAVFVISLRKRKTKSRPVVYNTYTTKTVGNNKKQTWRFGVEY